MPKDDLRVAQDIPEGGRERDLSTCRVDEHVRKLKQVLDSGRRLSARMMAEQCNIITYY